MGLYCVAEQYRSYVTVQGHDLTGLRIGPDLHDLNGEHAMQQKRSGSSSKKKKKLGRSKKLKLGALAGLGVITIAVAGAALLKGGQSDGAGYTPVPVAIPATTLGAGPSASPQSSLAVGGSPQDQIRALVAGSDNIVISVLGDSTGDASNEWVSLWAQHLAGYGTVTLHNWSKEANDWHAQPKVWQGGARQIVIRNGSMPGKTYTYPLERLDVMQPEKPTFTILNFGHNIAAKTADMGSIDLLSAIDTKWGAKIPAAVTLQNPARGSRAGFTGGSVAALSTWLPNSGYATIDVNSAFAAGGDLSLLLTDEVHPNPQGSKIWVDTVISALG